MTFAAGGRQRTATWRYEPLGGSVAPANDEARWLSEEAAPGSIPTPHTAASADHDVYDVDADGGLGRTRAQRASHEPIDLMAAMREHSTRGRRGRSRRPSPASTPGDHDPRHDALPIEELAVDPASVPPPPAARARNSVSAHLDEPGDDRPDELVGGFPEDVDRRGSRAAADDSVTAQGPEAAARRRARRRPGARASTGRLAQGPAQRPELGRHRLRHQGLLSATAPPLPPGNPLFPPVHFSWEEPVSRVKPSVPCRFPV